MTTEHPPAETISQRLVARDPDAAREFYDRHAPVVMEYCRQLCPPERVDEAVLAAFVELLGRIEDAGEVADPDRLLICAARLAAASRIELANVGEQACEAAPQLIAANMNGELLRDDGPLRAHLAHCEACSATAKRLAAADEAFARGPRSEAPEGPRAVWLELFESAQPAEPQAPGSADSRGWSLPDAAGEGAPEGSPVPTDPAEPEATLAEKWSASVPSPRADATSTTDGLRADEWTAAQSQPGEWYPPQFETHAEPPRATKIRARRRSGGLLGAAKRVISGHTPDQTSSSGPERSSEWLP